MPTPDPGRLVAAATAPLPILFRAFGAAGASRQLAILPGPSRLLVIAAMSTVAHAAARVCTYGGVTLSGASPPNDYVQLFYMIDPPVGTALLTVSGADVATIIDAQYNEVEVYQGSQQGQTPNAAFTLVRGGLVVFGMSASSTAHNALPGTNERVDFTGNWFGDSAVESVGSSVVTVGVVAATAPDYAGAIFNGLPARCQEYLTTPDGTPIDMTPGAIIPHTIIRNQRLGVATWAIAPVPEVFS